MKEAWIGKKSAAWAPVAWGNGGLQQIAPTTVVGQCGISTFDKLIQISTKIMSEMVYCTSTVGG